MTTAASRCLIVTVATLLIAAAGATTGCQASRYHPERATRPYPMALHNTDSDSMQVFRDDADLTIVNSTAHDYQGVDIWINQRYVDGPHDVLAGKTITINLWSFHDAIGEQFNAGGFWRSVPPSPVELVELQMGPDVPMLGLTMIHEDR